MHRPYLSVVVPAYRQARTICAELTALDTLLRTIVPSQEIILVIDGNEDDTLDEVTKHLALSGLRIESFEDNLGKGAAVRHGLLQARGELVAFIDSGGDVRLADLVVMLEELKLHNADIVIGSKRHSLSEVAYPPLRRLYSWVYQVLNRLLFRLRIRDTQVGLKVFRRQVLAAVLPRILVKQFAFDLEILVVANHLGFRRIVESPVTLRYGFTSSVTWTAVWQTLWDTLAVFYRLRILRWYDTVHPAATPVITPVTTHGFSPAPKTAVFTIIASEMEPHGPARSTSGDVKPQRLADGAESRAEAIPATASKLAASGMRGEVG